MNDALKSNTTLTMLDLSCEHERNNTNDIHQQSTLFPFFSKSTDNDIGETGRASLSDALQTNTTLTELILKCEQSHNSAKNVPFHLNKQKATQITKQKHHFRVILSSLKAKQDEVLKWTIFFLHLSLGHNQHMHLSQKHNSLLFCD